MKVCHYGQSFDMACIVVRSEQNKIHTICGAHLHVFCTNTNVNPSLLWRQRSDPTNKKTWQHLVNWSKLPREITLLSIGPEDFQVLFYRIRTHDISSIYSNPNLAA